MSSYEPTNDTAYEEEEGPPVEEGRIIKQQTQSEKERKKKTKIQAQRYIDMDPLSWTLPQPAPIRNQTSEEFMFHYISMKRRYNISLPWDDNETNDDERRQQRKKKKQYDNMNPKVSLPLPIISLNFPKSATLTMSAYFDCAGLTSIHTSTQSGRIGTCMLENQLHNNPPMHNCDRHIIRRQRRHSSHGQQHDDDDDIDESGGRSVPIDFISDIGLQGPPCYYASLHDGGLENIARHYPNATILLVTRDASSWYRSMSKWGGIMGRWKKYCRFDGHLHTTTTNNHNNNNSDSTNIEYWRNMFDQTVRSREKEEMYWINFYHAHTQKIREFALSHLSMTYIEAELENPNIGSILQQYTKVSPDCVLSCHPGPHWIKKHNTITKCHPIGQEPALLKEGEIWPGYENLNHSED